jgi:hypothetical protein
MIEPYDKHTMSCSTPLPPFPKESKLEAIGDKTHYIESDRGKQSAGYNEFFTIVSLTANGVEKSEFSEDNGPASEEKAVDKLQPPLIKYTKGIEMLFIMLALPLSITFCSLDQVHPTAPSFS